MPPPVVLIGHDPRKYTTGIRATSLRTRWPQARPASRRRSSASARPPGPSRRVGTIHRVATPLRHFLLDPVNTRPVAFAIAEYLTGCGHEPPNIIHGFGQSVGAAVAATEELSRRGIAAVPVASAYTVVAHEWRGLLRSLDVSQDVRSALFHAAWYPWVRTAITRVERRGAQGSRVVLVNYDSVARLLREAYGTGLEIRRIPYAAVTAFDGASARASAPAPASIADLQPRDAPLVVTVARHSPSKGLDVLLRALASLRDAGVGFRACLVGPGRLLDAHRRLSSRLGLDRQVAITGYVDDVLLYLQRADVFVLPSLEEGRSVALLEALQLGTAIVASSCDGIPEDVTDGQDALLVPPGNVGALRDALARLIGDPGLRAALGARAASCSRNASRPARSWRPCASVYAELGVSP